MVKYILNGLLAIVVLFLCYQLYKQIEEPVTFEENRVVRLEAAKTKLKQIKNAQLAYKGVTGEYAPRFDTLVQVLKNDTFKIIKVIGNPDDEYAKEEVVYDTIRVPVRDSIFKGTFDMVMDSMMYIPFTNGEKFNLEATTIEKSRVDVPVFMSNVSLKVLYNGLNERYYDKTADLRVGSLTEISTSGNWE